MRLNFCDHKVAAVEHRKAAARQGRAQAHRDVLPAVVEEEKHVDSKLVRGTVSESAW